MSSTTPQADLHPALLVLGVLNAPNRAGALRRTLARATWLTDEAVLHGHTRVRFVLGDLRGCEQQRKSIEADAAMHGDVIFVDAPDCRMIYSPEKTHAWFKFALHAFRSALWLGKTEDDAMVWPTALLADLAGISEEVELYGHLHWQGSCRPRHVSEKADCAGCYGGALAQGASTCRPAWCQGQGDTRCCQLGCPETTRMAPFALGALDVRRRSLAAALAACSYAHDYFRLVSANSAVLAALCATTDGSQGHVLGECVPSVHVADAASRHLDGTRSCTDAHDSPCARGHIAVLHPLKKASLASWSASWRHLARQAPFVLTPLVEARVDGMGPQVIAASRPPSLFYVREVHGRIQQRHNRSVWDLWRRRWRQLTSQLRSRRPSAKGRLGAAAGRRLRQVWATNCSLQWTSGFDAVLEEYVRTATRASATAPAGTQAKTQQSTTQLTRPDEGRARRFNSH